MKTTVLLGDPRLPDPVKRDGQFNPEDLETIANLKQTLNHLKKFDFHFLDDHKTLFQTLINEKPDFVFNLCDEGFNNQATKELHVPAILELLDIPYTGAGPSCLATCYNKSTIRLIANHMNIPVPTEYYLAPKDSVIPNPSSYPVLIKPNFGDGSFGITRHSVIQNHEEFFKQIEVMREQFPHTPLLIQEFLTGSEYSVGIIGNPGNFEVLPLIEIDFSALPDDLPKILSYESKWLSESPYWKKVVFKEATLTPQEKETLTTYATALFERTECRDYARFDFRCDQNGNFKLLEVNPNPGLNWLTFEDYADEHLIAKILHAALRRYGL